MRQAGNGTAKTRRTDQWDDSLAELGVSSLASPQLSDCFCSQTPSPSAPTFCRRLDSACARLRNDAGVVRGRGGSRM